MSDYPPAPRPGGSGEHHDGVGDGFNYGPEPTPSAPTCPRHPERVAYVRCQRCNRPVCPDCQRQAPVGVQCVDCVQTAAKQIRPQRTIFGGRTVSAPYATMTLIGINVAVYLLGMVTPLVRDLLIFWPAVGTFEPYRAITTGFLHGGILHLALNMYALWLIGTVLEQALGRWRFLSLYFLSLFGGTVAVVLFATPGELSWRIGVVGASGAVFGLFSAIFFVMRHIGRNVQQILIVVVANFVFSFTVPNISWQAHLGGLVVGAALALIFTRLPKERQLIGGVMSVGLIALALIAAYFGIYLTK